MKISFKSQRSTLSVHCWWSGTGHYLYIGKSIQGYGIFNMKVEINILISYVAMEDVEKCQLLDISCVMC